MSLIHVVMKNGKPIMAYGVKREAEYFIARELLRKDSDKVSIEDIYLVEPYMG